MLNLKFLFIIFILINNSLSNLIEQENKKYWETFQSWCNAYGKSFDPSIIQEKFITFKENYDLIIKENSLYQAPFVTVQYNEERSIQLVNNAHKRELLAFDASIPEIILPSLNEFQIKSLNQFSDLSHGEFISYYTGLEGGDITILDPTETGAKELGIGEISGIIIGSVIGGLAIIGAIVVGIKKYIKRKTQENKIKKVFKGINLYDLKPGQHQSITGRGVPIDLNN